MRYRKAPDGFGCPYRNACPHMDGISAQWASDVFRDQWRMGEQVRTLEADLKQLREENNTLLIERDRLKAQFTALHRRQFKATRSEAPPPAAPERGLPKKRGAPIGHPPWQRPIPDHVDQTVPVAAPVVCPHCACSALLPSTETVEQIQEDIVLPPRPQVTRFLHDTAFCPKCRRPVYATAPGELRNCSIGPTTKAVGVWLHHQLRLPFRQVQYLLGMLFGMPFVPASALAFSLAAAGKGQPLYDDLREKIRSAGLLHLDETSWRIDGHGAWLWYAGNADLDFFHIDPSRATSVIAAILGDDFGGDIVSDDYAVYNLILARWRQTCLAHIIRTAKEVAAELRLIEPPTGHLPDIAFATSIAEFFSEVCALDRKRRAGRLSRQRARAMVPKLRCRLKALCSATLSHPKSINLRDRLLSPKRDAKKLFTFLTRPGMPPTNNHAERALRSPVLARKISFGSRSNVGAHAFAVLASLLGTARRQNQPLLQFLYTLLTADTSAAQAALFDNSA